jgi:hypothetical protein
MNSDCFTSFESYLFIHSMASLWADAGDVSDGGGVQTARI